MPVKKTHLNREERARYVARAKELQAAQVNCEVPCDWLENSQHLDIDVAASMGNILCELSSGMTAYAICVRLVAHCANLRLDDCRIMSPWDFESIVLCQSEEGLYRVGSAFEFTEGDVLNHRIESGLRFHRRGDVFEGWVVASGLKLVPDQYRDGMITKLSLTFTDQFGCDHSAHAEAALQRSVKNSVSRVRKSPGLFGIRNPRNEISSHELPQTALRAQSEGREGGEYQRQRRQDDDGSVRSAPAD